MVISIHYTDETRTNWRFLACKAWLSRDEKTF